MYQFLLDSCKPLKWHHDGRYGVSNHLRLDCLFNHSLECRSKKLSKLRVTGLCGDRWIPRTKGTHVLWCMPGSLTSGFLWSRRPGKCSRHSRRMRNPHFYVTGKRPIWQQTRSCAILSSISVRKTHPKSRLCVPWLTQGTLVMMTSSNGNIFRVTGHLCGEFTGPRWIPHTKASDAELWCSLWSAPE